MKTPAARLVGAAIAAVLALGSGLWAVVYAFAALGPDGTAYDVLGAVACLIGAAWSALLAWRGTR